MSAPHFIGCCPHPLGRLFFWAAMCYTMMCCDESMRIRKDVLCVAKLRVAVIFGGMSSEHAISCLSAAAIVEHLDCEQFEVLKLGITKKGNWLMYPGDTQGMRDGSWERFADCVPAFISPDRTTHGIVANHDGRFDVVKIDVAFPALHGRWGEDGTVQGLLALSGIPYVGCNVLCSAVAMDKAFANLIFEAHSLPHTPWMAIDRRSTADFESILFRMREVMDYPVVVKPAVGGSSIGVSLVNDDEELRSSIQLAMAHDKTILLEKAVKGAEVECAVLGCGELLVSVPGEIVSCKETYDYEAKYESGDASKLYIPARLDEKTQRQIQDMALCAYRSLSCEGLARVDFFVREEDGCVLLNEVNTLPGFTAISMYPKLMEHMGVSFGTLLERLIGLALERAEV